MEILVCARRVPDTSENEITLNSAGNDIERDELVYSVNEPDNYAVEEALQIRDRVGGNVTVVTIGGEDDGEILRRELAMGANQAALLSDYAAQRPKRRVFRQCQALDSSAVAAPESTSASQPAVIRKTCQRITDHRSFQRAKGVSSKYGSTAD